MRLDDDPAVVLAAASRRRGGVGANLTTISDAELAKVGAGFEADWRLGYRDGDMQAMTAAAA
jgi:hypothetical protein